MEQEKRKTERLKEFNEITTTIISGEKNFYNYSEDISVSGAKIRGNITLPVDTLLNIDFTLNNLQQKITDLGKMEHGMDLKVDCINQPMAEQHGKN